MTAVAHDSLGNVWTGHLDGSISVHQPGRWGSARLARSYGVPVRAIAVDDRNQAYAGGEGVVLGVLGAVAAGSESEEGVVVVVSLLGWGEADKQCQPHNPPTRPAGYESGQLRVCKYDHVRRSVFQVAALLPDPAPGSGGAERSTSVQVRPPPPPSPLLQPPPRCRARCRCGGVVAWAQAAATRLAGHSDMHPPRCLLPPALQGSNVSCSSGLSPHACLPHPPCRAATCPGAAATRLSAAGRRLCTPTAGRWWRWWRSTST